MQSGRLQRTKYPEVMFCTHASRIAFGFQRMVQQKIETYTGPSNRNSFSLRQIAVQHQQTASSGPWIAMDAAFLTANAAAMEAAAAAAATAAAKTLQMPQAPP